MPTELDLAGLNDPFNPFQKIARALRNLGDVTEENVNSLSVEVTAIPIIRKVGFPEVNFATGTIISKGRRLAKRPVAGKFAGYMTIPEYLQGLEELQNILKSKEIFKIAQRNYDLTVRAAIKTKTNERSTLNRGGAGGGGNPLKGDIMFLTRPDFELGTQWRQIVKELDVPLVELPGNQLGSFSLQQILQHNVTSYRSRFTNVYMMVEFGTGQFASPGPRRYSGGATPFKVTGSMAVLGGDTSWWFSNLLQKKIAQNMLKSKFNKEGQFHSLENITFGHGPKGITPLGVLFNNRGMVTKLRLAYQKFYELTIRDINELIASKVPFWPKDALKPNDKAVIQIVKSYEDLFKRLTNGR